MVKKYGGTLKVNGGFKFKRYATEVNGRVHIANGG